MSETKEKKDFSCRPQLPPEIVRKPSPDTATSVAVANHQQRPEATADADALRELKGLPTPAARPVVDVIGELRPAVFMEADEKAVAQLPTELAKKGRKPGVRPGPIVEVRPEVRPAPRPRPRPGPIVEVRPEVRPTTTKRRPPRPIVEVAPDTGRKYPKKRPPRPIVEVAPYVGRKTKKKGTRKKK